MSASPIAGSVVAPTKSVSRNSSRFSGSKTSADQKKSTRLARRPSGRKNQADVAGEGAAEATLERAEQILLKEIAFVPCQSFPTDRRIESKLELIRQIEHGRQPGATTEVDSDSHTQFTTLGAVELLSPEEEREGFRRMNLLRSRANALRSRLRASSPDERIVQRIDEALSRADRLQHHLIQANTRLVMSLARKYVSPRVAFDELLSQGIRALMYAIEKFDYSRGYRFSTYATCALRRDFYRFVMNYKRHNQRYCTGSQEALAEISQTQHGSGLTESELTSLTKSIASIVSELDDRERVIIANRFDLENNGKTLSYSKLGEKLGISKERVRQLANRALDKLRGAAKAQKLDALLT